MNVPRTFPQLIRWAVDDDGAAVCINAKLKACEFRPPHGGSSLLFERPLRSADVCIAISLSHDP